MAETHTFEGDKYRVQLKVTGMSEEMARRLTEMNPNQPALEAYTRFTVRVLPQSAHKLKAFVQGQEVYSGFDFDAAWDAIRRYAPAIIVPAKFRKYDAPKTGR